VNAPDAIEPISLGRLYLYLGESLVGGTTPTNELPGNAGYFLDPSCAYLSGVSGCGTGSVSGDTWVTPSVTPAVTPILTGTPAGTDGGGTLGNGDTPTGLFLPIRTLYLYFRSTDLNSTTTWQPGSTQNWVNALFYNPGGATPYIQTGAGQTLLEDAGVVPAGVNGTPAEACLNITTNVAC
jgi:hypothetical protein